MGAVALGIAVLSISWGSILVRLCVAPALTLAFGRLAGASLILLPWGVASARGAGATRSGARAGSVAGALFPAAAAGVLLALHFATWIASLALTSVAASTVLVSTQPIFSAGFSWALLRERPSGRVAAAIALALAGAVAIVAADLARDAGRFRGDLLALAGAVLAAAYFVIGRGARARAPFPVYMLAVNLAAATAAAVLAVASGQPLLPPRRSDLAWIAVMALVPHTLGHGALNWAVRRLRAYIVNVAVLGEPVLASVYAAWIFGERPAGSLYAGGLLVIAGVAWAVREESRRPAAGAGGPAQRGPAAPGGL